MPAVTVRFTRPRFNGLSYEAWETVRDGVKKGKTAWYRPSRLSPVNKAVKAYCKCRTIQKRLAVDDAIHRIRTQGKTAFEKYKAPLEWLIQQLESTTPHQIGINLCAHFGPGVGRLLNDIRHYAVTDLKSFPGSIRPGHVGRVWNRYYQMTPGDLGQDGKAGARVRFGFDRQAIRSASRFLAAGRCGCCTTFAAHAANILLENGCTSRIEVVAVPTRGRVAHCFVLVGRKGHTDDGTIPKNSILTWGPDWCVVDPWLAALGYNCIFPLGQGFPNMWLRGSFSSDQKSKSAGLEQKFDSTAAAATPADFLRGVKLKKTGKDVTQ